MSDNYDGPAMAELIVKLRGVSEAAYAERDMHWKSKVEALEKRVAEAEDAADFGVKCAVKERDAWQAEANRARATIGTVMQECESALMDKRARINELEARVRTLEEKTSLALSYLEATRWMGSSGGDLRAWAQTPEGLNHARVCDAMERLRAALQATPEETPR